MSDEPSDPQSSHALHSSPVETIPPPDEPKTPAWLTLVGLGVLLLALGWLAARCTAESKEVAPADNGNAAPAASANR